MVVQGGFIRTCGFIVSDRARGVAPHFDNTSGVLHTRVRFGNPEGKGGGGMDTPEKMQVFYRICDDTLFRLRKNSKRPSLWGGALEYVTRRFVPSSSIWPRKRMADSSVSVARYKMCRIYVFFSLDTAVCAYVPS
ncbi:protein E6F [Elephant endotheliotropic herpesvirus 3B]|nr:protein E6F [Elephant endotheliotropic herpesvirus 3B]